MARKSEIERHYTACLRTIKRLWEHLNSADCIFADIKKHKNAISSSHSFPNALSISPKTVTRAELIDSAQNLRETLMWKWGLIVAIAYFDAWMEELVEIVHNDFRSTKNLATSRKYNFDTPSFNMNFFTNDKAGLGLTFNPNDQHLKDFVKWKEARNCLVHKGGRITKRFAGFCNPPGRIGKQLKLSSAELRNAFQAILTFTKDIQRFARKEIRAQRQARSLRNGPSAP